MIKIDKNWNEKQKSPYPKMKNFIISKGLRMGGGKTKKQKKYMFELQKCTMKENKKCLNLII